jgi:uncharacterized protein with WD repeat
MISLDFCFLICNTFIKDFYFMIFKLNLNYIYQINGKHTAGRSFCLFGRKKKEWLCQLTIPSAGNQSALSVKTLFMHDSFFLYVIYNIF